MLNTLGKITLAFLLYLPLATHAADLERAAPEDAGMSSERLDRLTEAMQAYVDDGKLAGMVALVSRNDKVVYLEAVGEADMETGRAMTPDTIVRIASMTKPVTSVAVMMLYEEGHFLLSDPIAKYLPELADLEVYESGEGDGMVTRPAARQVTIHDLLTHQAGFIYGNVITPGPLGAAYDAKAITLSGVVPAGIALPQTLEEFTTRLGQMPLAHDPGTQWSYGVSTDVLGRLVEVVSGMSLGDFFQARIFGPLGMTDTAFFVPEEKQDRFASVYTIGEDGALTLVGAAAERNYLNPTSQALSGGGGLVSTAMDYARFSLMLLNGGALDGVRIVSPKTVDLMSMNHLPDTHPTLPIFPGAGFGLGFAVITDAAATKGLVSEGEYSWAGFFSTDFWIDPEEDLVAVVLTQHLAYGTYPIRADAHRFIYGAIEE